MDYYEEIGMYEGDVVRITRLDNGKKEVALVKWSDEDYCVCYYIKGRGFVYRATLNMNPEILGKQIPNFPNYAITKDGKIWSFYQYRYLTKYYDKDGYVKVVLFKKKKRYYKRVHRLVLEAFVGKCPKGMTACHNDAVKDNNSISNLRWDTPKNNTKDTIVAGKHPCLTQKGENHSQAKLTEQDVRMIIYMWRTKEFAQQEIADTYSITRSSVNHIINRRTWKHIWRN